MPESSEFDEDDEVMLDVEEIERPLNEKISITEDALH